MSESGLEKLAGKIEAAGYDLDGSLIAVQLKVRSGKTFLIEDNPKGEQLLRYLGHSVEAEGNTRKDIGMSILCVEKFVVLGEV